MGICRSTFVIVGLCLLVVLWANASRADQNHPQLPDLFDQLKMAPTAVDAGPVEAMIWQIWVVQGEEIIDSAMARGLIAMNRGALKASLRYFDDVVSLAPDFAEGWNKRATVYFLMGNYEQSIQDVYRTLELEPRHFGALSGLGLIYMELGETRKAIAAMEAALKIHPNMEAIKAHVRDLRNELEGQKT